MMPSWEVALEALMRRNGRNTPQILQAPAAPPSHHPVLCPFEPEPCSCASNGRLTAGERFSTADSKRARITFTPFTRLGEQTLISIRHRRLASKPVQNGRDSWLKFADPAQQHQQPRNIAVLLLVLCHQQSYRGDEVQRAAIMSA